MKNKYLIFRVLNGFTAEAARKELEQKGLKGLFVIEEGAVGEIFIGGHARKKIEAQKSILVEEKGAHVNWEEQWSLYAENFVDGKAHIPIGDKMLLLAPGAGFGDLSHPTTHLMLDMMKKYVEGESVIDIGTGSGILALAALLLGAKSATGIDIDPAALKHAKENAKLNHLNPHFSKTLPKKLASENILLMNMIFPEQKEFAPQRLNSFAKLWIVSGILVSQKNKYLAQAKKWGWQPISEHKKGEWLGWAFIINYSL